jgi:RNA polymerase sigma-70 factor (ECF subfamily)
MHSFTDEQLMELFQQHIEGQGRLALDLLYERYAGRLLSYFYYSLQKDWHKAQDFVHDLFLKIMQKPDKFDTNQSFQAWTFRLASNMCKNEYRSRRVMNTFKEHVLLNNSVIFVNDDTNKLLRICLDSLNPEQRSLMILRFKLDLSVREMAEIYECPEGTIKSRLFYATKALSKLYNK